MGFIPIFITLGAAVLLFILVVRQSIQSKKSQFKEFCAQTWLGLQTFQTEKEEIPSFEEIKKSYLEIKPMVKPDREVYFNQEVRKPYQQAKLVQAQYNKLIVKKPYSFISKLFGYQSI